MITSNEKSNRALYVRRILFMVLLVILADQSVESVLIETVASLEISYGSITNIYLLSAMPFALILATWSDFHCRRKTMIFSLTFLLLSALAVFLYRELGCSWIIYLALFFKGVFGNVTPIALASLATIVPRQKLAVFLALAICAYSAGIWIPIYLHSFQHLPLLSVMLALVCTLIIIRWFREPEFDDNDLKFQNNKASLKKFFAFLRKDVIAIVVFSMSVPVILAFFAFLTSEFSYYQILLRGEVLETSRFYSDLSIKMAAGYYVGTILLYFLIRKHLTDIKCLLIGVLLALVSICASYSFKYFGLEGTWLFEVLFAFFSIGFALLTPCLFTILSKIYKKDEQGKIFGFLDIFDTLATYIGVKYIGLSKTLSFNPVLRVSLIGLLISSIFITAFIRYIKERQGRAR